MSTANVRLWVGSGHEMRVGRLSQPPSPFNLLVRPLELEITQSVFIADVDRTFAKLHSLRDLGVGISLDDFGNGWSSLSYLRQFPFDKIKIDQGFVRDLAQQGNNAHAVVRAITTLGDALSMETLAEGFEDPAQCQILRDEGYVPIQCYLFSRPIPVASVIQVLESVNSRTLQKVSGR